MNSIPKKIITTPRIACVLLCALSFLPFLAPAAETPVAPPARVTPPGATRDTTLRSALLQEERRVLIRLPRRYETDATVRYPVIFKFDGDNGLKRYDDTIDILASAGVMPDCIVIAIPNAPGQRNRDLTPAALHQDGTEAGTMGTGPMGQGDRFLAFLAQELIPYVDQNFRTTAPRILAGHSRGALLVVQSLLSEPDLFQARFCFSAPLMRDEQRMISDTRAFLEKHPRHRSFIYFNWGTEENQGMGKSHDAMRELLAARAPEGLRWVIERAPGGDHQQTPLLALPAALTALFGPLPRSR